jgi:hypothetical protein
MSPATDAGPQQCGLSRSLRMTPGGWLATVWPGCREAARDAR